MRKIDEENFICYRLRKAHTHTNPHRCAHISTRGCLRVWYLRGVTATVVVMRLRGCGLLRVSGHRQTRGVARRRRKHPTRCGRRVCAAGNTRQMPIAWGWTRRLRRGAGALVSGSERACRGDWRSRLDLSNNNVNITHIARICT